MTGKVNTREKCRICGSKFAPVEGELKCCNTRPDTYYLYLYHKGDHRISRDRDGRILDSYKRAERLLETIRGEIDRGTFDPKIFIPKQAEEYRIKVLIYKWLRGKKDRSNWLKYKYDKYITNYYIPALGELHASELRRYEIEKLLESLPDHLAVKTKKNIMDGFRNFVRWLQEMEILNKHITFPVLSPVEPVIKWIDKPSQMALLDKIPDRHKPIFSFLMSHPVRIGEACALKKKHFDLDRMTVTIEQSAGYREIKARKNNRAYVLPLSCNFDRSILSDKLPEAFVFQHSRGSMYTTNSLSGIWRKISPGINLYNATRHSIASQAVNNGVPLERIGNALGHVNTKMTRRYASMNVELLRDVVDGTTSQILPIGSKKSANSGKS